MQYYVYILTNVTGTTIYVGITNDLVSRMYEHKHKLVESRNPLWEDLYESILP